MRLLGDQSSKATTGTPGGLAGWGGAKTTPVDFGSVTALVAGGAYGLFVMNSASAGAYIAAEGETATNVTQSAVLGAVFYGKSTVSFALSGSPLSGGAGFFADHNTASQGVLFPTNSNGNFVMQIGTVADLGATGTPTAGTHIEFNFDRNSDKYIRKVFNTNPTLLNDSITDSNASQNYFLGETFDTCLRTGSLGGATNASASPPRSRATNISAVGDINNAIVLGLDTQRGNNGWEDHAFSQKDGQTGWIVGQDLGEATAFNYTGAQKLFKIWGLNHGAWLQNNVKVSIEEIRPSSNDSDDYGTFSVTLRRIGDNDKNPVVIERFSNCNLNPNSADYLCRKIGDRYITWDDTDARIREYGTWPNQSKFIRIEPLSDLDDGAMDPRYLPFGYHSAPQWHNIIGLGNLLNPNSPDQAGTLYGDTMIRAENEVALYEAGLFIASASFAYHSLADAADTVTNNNLSNCILTASYFMPCLPLRINATDGNMAAPTDAYFGVNVGRVGAYNTFDDSVIDIVRAASAGLTVGSNNFQSSSIVFTLDDLSGSNDNGAVFVSGSRVQSTTALKSLSAIYGYGSVLTGSTLDADEGHIGGFNRFTTLFHGGFDGWDVTEKDPLRQSAFATSPTSINDYKYHTVKRAIDTMRDTEFMEFNLATMPGIDNESLTGDLIETCEERGDALAIIDLTGDYTPRSESTANAATRRPNVGDTVRNLRLRSINSSYGAAYFPWVMIRDTNSNQIVDMPPSVVALGTMSNSERKKALWFAPAGFTRGGLSEGAAGIPVVGVKYQLNAKERDELYGANINPIATFPAEGIVIFGQKTLQVTASALDRVNVRRLLIYVKKQVSRLAATTLFEQNIMSTWDKFSSRVESLLSGIKAAQGLMDYRVVLNKSTTTPEMIDRNIMYAKIFLKPARAIEFIALDFVVTDSGASFDD
jgi:hypothetical protein